jgi:glycosyltransferase involved in cell wall biosynthesis
VYKQGLTADDFEIIVVDDCSPKEEARQCLRAMAAEPQYADNLRLLKTPQNVRQGGARNLGVKSASGQYIVYIDQDDWLNDGALSQIKSVLSEEQLDVLMVNYYDYDGTRMCSTYDYSKNSKETMTGEEFILKNEVPWCPWCYIYRREFLLENNLHFEEKVRFEDADLSMAVTLSAQKMAFRNIYNIVHYEHECQTSIIGNDYSRIKDFMHMAWRIKNVALSFQKNKPQGATIVLGHHYFMYAKNIERFLWRLPAMDIYDIITTYPAEEHAPDRLTRLSVKHPRLTSRLLAAARPLLMTLWRAKRFIEQARN